MASFPRRFAIETPQMLTTFTANDLKVLLARREAPCISLYMPTHRRKRDGRSDVILFRNLCRNVERILAKDVPSPVTRDIVARLGSYDEEELWDECHASDGLCVFAAPGFQQAYRLPGHFPQLEVVGSSFHTKPLIRHLQGNTLSYYLLALNMRRVALYEGLGDSIRDVALKGVPLSLNGGESRSSGEGSPRHGDGSRMHYGQGGAREHTKTDLEKFFRVVAKELWKNHLRTSAKSLILAAPAQHQTLFRKVAQIPTLLDVGVVSDPAKMSPDELHAEARRALEPAIARRIERAKEEFGLARSRSQGTDSLNQVASLVAEGRIQVLFVESGRRIWGVLNPKTGEILPGDRTKNAYDVDLLDEIAELTLVKGGEVFVLRKEDMPCSSGIAAIQRF